jgi:hypothetical protein
MGKSPREYLEKVDLLDDRAKYQKNNPRILSIIFYYENNFSFCWGDLGNYFLILP